MGGLIVLSEMHQANNKIFKLKDQMRYMPNVHLP